MKEKILQFERTAATISFTDRQIQHIKTPDNGATHAA